MSSKKSLTGFFLLVLAVFVFNFCATEPVPTATNQDPVWVHWFEPVDTLQTEHFVRLSQYMLELNAATHGDLFESMRTVLDTTRTTDPDALYHLKYKYRVYLAAKPMVAK